MANGDDPKLDHDKVAEAAERRAKAAAKSADDVKREVDLAKELLDLYQKQGGAIDDIHSKWDDVQEKQIQYHRKLLEEAEKSGTAGAQRIKDLQDELEGLEKNYKKVRQIRSATEELVEGISGMSDKWKSSFVGGLVDPATSLETKLTGIQQGLASSVTTANFLAASFGKIAELSAASFMELQDALPAFNAATGQAGALNDEIIRLTAGARNFAADMKDVGDSFTALMANVRGFNTMSGATRDELVLLGVGLGKLGLDATTSARFFDNLIAGLGVAPSMVDDVVYDLAGAAQALEMPFAELAKGLDDAMPRLAMFGKDAPRIFKRIAAQAKATGIETQKLLGIVSQYDTFEGAAKAAQGLNAILGGAYLNSVELLTAKDEERVVILRRAIAESGRSWEAMDRHTRQAVASAAGISDMNEAAKLFTSSLSDLQDGFGDVNVEQQEFDKMVDSATTLADKFKAFWMAAIQPLIPAIQWMIEGIGSLLDKVMALGTGWTASITGASLLIGIFVSLKLVSWMVGVAIGIVAKAAAGATPAITAFGTAATAATPLVTALGFSTTTLVPVMALVTVAILAVAAAIAILVWGVVKIVQAFTNLATVMLQNKDALGPFAIALGAVVAAAYLLANPVAMAGILALAGGVTGIAMAMHMLPLEKLKTFSQLMSTVNEMAQAGVTVNAKMGVAGMKVTATGAEGGGKAETAQEIKVEVILKGSDALTTAIAAAAKTEVQKLHPIRK
jgi:hypothetical protein